MSNVEHSDKRQIAEEAQQAIEQLTISLNQLLAIPEGEQVWPVALSAAIIRNRRIDLGLEREDVAALCDASAFSVGQAERNPQKMTVSKLTSILGALGMELCIKSK